MKQLFGSSSAAVFARLALIAGIAAVVAFAGVFTMPPLDRDEARFAQATAQMLETGDFIAIRFQDEERNKKPPGIHWLQAASVSLFSSVEAREIWAYRLPSALGVVFAALFTYAGGARLYGPRTGFLAALLLASAPGVAAEATIAKTDAMLLAAVTAAETAFIYIFAGLVEGRREKFCPFAFWFALGFGILIKGPIILMIVGLTLGAVALHQPGPHWFRALRPVSGLFILTLMIAPWAAAIDHATEGRFFAEAIGGDMLAKLGAASESHGGPPGYYFALLFALFWPAAALILPGLRAMIASRADWRSWFLLSWIAPSWVVFELAATKLPHYTLPLYPAIAIIAAHAATSGVPERAPRLRRIGATLYALAGLAIVAITLTVPLVFRQPALPAANPVLLVAALLGLWIAFRSLRFAVAFGMAKHAPKITTEACLSSALVAWLLLGFELPRATPLVISPRIAATLDEAGLHPLRDGAPSAVLSGYSEPSAVFLLGTNTLLADDGAEAADAFAETGGAAVIEARERDAFLARLAERGATARPFAEVAGVNYSNGRDIVLTLYAPPGDSR